MFSLQILFCFTLVNILFNILCEIFPKFSNPNPAVAQQNLVSAESESKISQNWKRHKPIRHNFSCTLLEVCSYKSLLPSLMLIVIDASPCILIR